jgi:hypothetical protein
MSRGAAMPQSRISDRRGPVEPRIPASILAALQNQPMPPRTMPGAPVNPRVGMAAGGYIPEAGFGQSPYNMGMNQLDPYSPMPTYLAQNAPNFVNRAALGGGGTVGYAAGGEVGYAPGGFIPQAQYPAMPPAPAQYGLPSLVNRGMQ